MNQQTRRELLQRLAEASETDLDAAAIADHHRLRDDLGLGSLDAIMLLLDLEDHYDVDVTDDELAALDTVGSLLALVDAKRPTGSPDQP
jgi:acyl carrier protein